MSARIVSYKGYVAGWLDTSVHDFLEVLSPASLSAKYALITCLDSNPNPASLRTKSPELKPIANKLKVLGAGLLISTESLLEVNSRRRIFFGFDEIWFFPSKDIRPYSSPASLVGPGRVTQEHFNRMGKWMADNSCSLALGGGEGLNFIVKAHGLVKFLLGYSIEQRDSALVSA
jgi:hypothetical protein